MDKVTEEKAAAAAVEDADAEETEDNEMTDEELAARCIVLSDSITLTVFNYIRRGLFEKDKLTVATMLTLKILEKNETLSSEEIDYLVAGKVSTDPGNMGVIRSWLPEALWPKIKALEGLKCFQKLGDDMQNDDDDWHKWFENPRSEEAKLPGDYKDLSPFHLLILLRAIRPDRVPTALGTYVGSSLSKEYVETTPFDMKQCYSETSPDTPVFFVLFAGVDPTPWVEGLGKTLDITIENGKF